MKSCIIPKGFAERSTAMGCILLAVSVYTYLFSRLLSILLYILSHVLILIGLCTLIACTLYKPKWLRFRRSCIITLLTVVFYVQSEIFFTFGLWTYFALNYTKLTESFSKQTSSIRDNSEHQIGIASESEDIIFVEVSGFLDARHGFLRSANGNQLTSVQINSFSEKMITVKYLKDGWYYFHS